MRSGQQKAQAMATAMTSDGKGKVLASINNSATMLNNIRKVTVGQEVAGRLAERVVMDSAGGDSDRSCESNMLTAVGTDQELLPSSSSRHGRNSSGSEDGLNQSDTLLEEDQRVAKQAEVVNRNVGGYVGNCGGKRSQRFRAGKKPTAEVVGVKPTVALPPCTVLLCGRNLEEINWPQNKVNCTIIPVGVDELAGDVADVTSSHKTMFRNNKSKRPKICVSKTPTTNSTFESDMVGKTAQMVPSSTCSAPLSPVKQQVPPGGTVTVRAVADSTQGAQSPDAGITTSFNLCSGPQYSQLPLVCTNNIGRNSSNDVTVNFNNLSSPALKTVPSRAAATSSKTKLPVCRQNVTPAVTKAAVVKPTRTAKVGQKRKSSLDELGGKDEDGRYGTGGRLLMRDWLERQADCGELSGIGWLDRSQGFIKIAWKHGSKSGWSEEDSRVFVSWAKYTGRYDPQQGQFKRWKANFRCALHSLPDVQEAKEKSFTRNGEQFKVYKLLTPSARKRSKSSGDWQKPPQTQRSCQSSHATAVASSPVDKVLSRRSIEDQSAVNSIASLSLVTPALSSPESPVLPSAASCHSNDEWLQCAFTEPSFLPENLHEPDNVVVASIMLPPPPPKTMMDHSYAGSSDIGNGCVQSQVPPPAGARRSVLPMMVEQMNSMSSDDDEADEDEEQAMVDSTSILQVESFHSTSGWQCGTDYQEMTPLQMPDNAVYHLNVESILPAVSVICVDGTNDFDSLSQWPDSIGMEDPLVNLRLLF